MLGKFDDGQKYDFYVNLTDQILDLVGSVKARSPSAFIYRGMDFGHAFESLLYFATVNDRGLNALYDAACGERIEAGVRLGGGLAQLLAEHWFGAAPAYRHKKPETTIYKGLRQLARGVRWQSAWPTPLPVLAENALPPRCDFLLYGRSLRFANYLAPVARAFDGRYAFLVPPEARDVQTGLAAAAKPFLAVAAARPRLRAPDSLICQYASHLAFFADGVEAAMLRLRPSAVVLAEGNSPDDEVINQVCKKLHIPTVCIQQGWSPIFHPGFCNLNYSAMLVWGQGFADLLASANPKQKFVSTGNFALTQPFTSPLEKPLGVLFFHQDLDRGLGGIRGSEMTIALAERLATQRPDIPIHYRPHPLVPLDDASAALLRRFSNVTIQCATEVSLDEALRRARVSVSIYSTTILESVAAGTVPIIFNMTTLPRYCPDVAMAGAGLELRSIDEALAAIDRLLSDEAYLSSFTDPMARFATRFFCARGLDAVDNTVRTLEELARSVLRP